MNLNNQKNENSYKECTYQIVRVVSGDININDLKDDEDFMSVDMWNSSDDKEHFPTINL
jgi:hypothetical protein